MKNNFYDDKTQKEPNVTLPEPPPGCRWEYRGRGAEFAGVCAYWREGHDQAYSVGEYACGFPTLHYWEAVVSEAITEQKLIDKTRIEIEELRNGILQAYTRSAEHNDRVLYVCMKAHHMAANKVIVELGGDAAELPALDRFMETTTELPTDLQKLFDETPQATESDILRLEKSALEMRLQIAITALEKARGWSVADEALKKIL